MLGCIDFFSFQLLWWGLIFCQLLTQGRLSVTHNICNHNNFFSVNIFNSMYAHVCLVGGHELISKEKTQLRSKKKSKTKIKCELIVVISERCLHMYRNWIVFQTIKILNPDLLWNIFDHFPDCSYQKFIIRHAESFLLSFIDFFYSNSLSMIFFCQLLWPFMCVNDCGKDAVKNFIGSKIYGLFCFSFTHSVLGGNMRICARPEFFSSLFLNFN